MKGNNINEENDLEIAKKFLDNMLALLDKDEKNRLLEKLLALTENI